MIYPAYIYNASGKLKKTISAEKLTVNYWVRFQEEEKKRYRRSLKFGPNNPFQKYIRMERMLDNLTNTEQEFEENG